MKENIVRRIEGSAVCSLILLAVVIAALGGSGAIDRWENAHAHAWVAYAMFFWMAISLPGILLLIFRSYDELGP